MAEGKQRQAEYRARMLAEGKRQYAFWLTDEQVAEIRAYLAGESSPHVQPEKAPETPPEPRRATQRVNPASMPIPGEHKRYVVSCYQVSVNGEELGLVWKSRVGNVWYAMRRRSGSVSDALSSPRRCRTKQLGIEYLVGTMEV